MSTGHGADTEQIEIGHCKEFAIICCIMSPGKVLSSLGKAFCIEIAEADDFYAAY